MLCIPCLIFNKIAKYHPILIVLNPHFKGFYVINSVFVTLSVISDV